MTKFARFIIAAILLTAWAQTAGAAPSPSPQPSPASNDPCGSLLSIVNRPAFGTGVCTVRTGHMDVETGYTNTVTTGLGGGATATYPQALLRFGTGDSHFDIEFGALNAERSRVGGAFAAGSSDASIGAKYELGYTSQALWGVSAVVTLPTGTAAFSAGRAQYTGSFNWGYAMNAEFGVAGALSANWLTAANANGLPQSYAAFVPSLEVTAALPGGPSQIGAEYAYFSSAGPGLSGKSWFDFIYQRDFGEHLQFDAEYGISPTPVGGQRQRYVGAGLSFMR